ncbi:MAG: phosphoglucosamine mutase [Thermaerobacterales bacterium]
MGQLFGTDGVRGVANRDLTASLAVDLGQAAGSVLRRSKDDLSPVILIGRDTRRSGDFLEAALAAGVAAAGFDALCVGVAPTPALAYLVRRYGAAAAAVISASHNPPEYNGIKFFGPDGYKLEDRLEEAIEAWVAARRTGREPAGAADQHLIGSAVGRVLRRGGGAEYRDFLRQRLGDAAVRTRIVLDCAHGALYDLAPRLLEAAGAVVTPLHIQPDGMNINVKCGSTHPEVLAAAVREHGAQVGFAFDGDGDRCIAVDEQGRIIDGDQIMAVVGLARLRAGQLPGRAIVTTVMSNLGLDAAIERAGGRVVRAAVGDRQVVAAMREKGLVMGGEQSGHLVFHDAGQTTGDGLLTAIEVLRVMAAGTDSPSTPLSALADEMETYPQILRNVEAADHQRAAADPAVAEAVRKAVARLGADGRILVRPSGTEPLIRVMGEGKDLQLLQEVVSEVVEAVIAVSQPI